MQIKSILGQFEFLVVLICLKFLFQVYILINIDNGKGQREKRVTKRVIVVSTNGLVKAFS